jgi:hypothetical protein
MQKAQVSDTTGDEECIESPPHYFSKNLAVFEIPVNLL